MPALVWSCLHYIQDWMASLSVCCHGNLCLYSLQSQKWGMQKNHPPSRLLLWPWSHQSSITNWVFFQIFWDQLDNGEFTQRERAAGICHSPLQGCLYSWCSSLQWSLPPMASTSCFLLQGMMGAGPPRPSLSIGVKLARRAAWRQRKGGRDRWDWMMVAIVTELVLGDSLKSVNANAFGSIITLFY